jgi:DNA-directed RNA polymerase subunit beta
MKLLGWAGQNLGRKYATQSLMVLLRQINELTDEAGIPRFGHTYLMMVVLESVFIKQQLLV